MRHVERSERRSHKAATRVVIGTLLALCVSLAAIPTAHANWLKDMLTSTSRSSTTTGASKTSTTLRHDWAACLVALCHNYTTTTTVAGFQPPAPPPERPAPASECQSMPKAGGGTWTCTFSDEFDGTQLDLDKWFHQTRRTAANTVDTHCATDDPDVIQVVDGALHLSVVKRDAPFDCYGFYETEYASGQVSTKGKFSQAYGRFEIRARVTGAKVPGLQEAIWMWPDKPNGMWPGSGEIDIAEIYHHYPDRAIPYVHYSNPIDPNVTNNFCMIDDIHEFHTFVLEWTKERIRVLYDGQVCLDDPWMPLPPYGGRQPFNKPFFLILSQMLGQGKNAFDSATTPLPASMVVDYVRVWQ